MLKIFFLILEFASLAMIVGILGFFLSLKSSVSSSKLSPFECGFSPRLSSRMPFSLQFFLVALIFVIFDLELILLFPYLLYSKIYFSANCFFLMVFFIFLLTLGLLLEWNQQMLEWVA